MSEDNLKLKASFYAGLATGAITKFLLHPIDTVKAHIIISQKQMSISNMSSRGIYPTARNIYSTRGIGGFYPAVFFSCVFNELILGRSSSSNFILHYHI